MKESSFTEEVKNSVVRVYNKEGNVLQPCTNKRARILLERGQATVVSYIPFTIQLKKETGDSLNTELEMRKGTVQLCLSDMGQNRTEFMLNQALAFSKKQKKVLFVSGIVNETVLDELIKQEVTAMETGFVEHFHAISASCANESVLAEWIDQFEPDVVILDCWKDGYLPRALAKKTHVAIWCGISTAKKLGRMPMMHDAHTFRYEQDASLIIGIYGNQATILKNRYGPNAAGKATHQKNIFFEVENA